MAGVAFSKIFQNKEVNLVNGVELFQSELNFLFTTPKHSLFFGNNLGVDLSRYLHLLNTQATLNLIKADIEDVLIKYGRVYLRKIEMNFNTVKDSLSINIEVSTDSQGRNIVEIPLTVGG